MNKKNLFTDLKFELLWLVIDRGKELVGAKKSFFFLILSLLCSAFLHAISNKWVQLWSISQPGFKFDRLVGLSSQGYFFV
jgi:hypothetical protein